MSKPPDLPAAGTVLIFVPGGLEYGGGIGRQIGYFLQAAGTLDGPCSYRVVDSRGPWFLGRQRFHVVLSVFYLARASAGLFAARFRGGRTIAHFNITGRGSTIRKIILACAARAGGIPYLLHMHDPDYAGEYRRCGRLLQSLIRTTFRSAELVLVLGSRDKEALSELLRIAPERVVVAHNAVPDPLPDSLPVPLRDAPRPARGGGPPTFLFLGHLSERKGVSLLLRALASEKVRSCGWRAILAGGGPVEEYRRLAQTLGIAERVEFSGWLDKARVGQLLVDADALVLPSQAEGLAMAVLEGLSHGLPVVTTPVGAHLEVIEPGISGLLVPVNDEAALGDALLRLATDAAFRDRLGAGARRRFIEAFEISGYASRLRQLHAGLLKRLPARRG